ncbi:MAG: hypothetical protein AB7Q00_13875 [Phycisphaerales bacterium]
MSSSYNDRKRQLKADNARAAEVSPTAFVARDKEGKELGVYDYGEYAGVGSRDLNSALPRIEAGLVKGREDEFDAFIKAQTDYYSRLLASIDRVKDRKRFNRELALWVEKWKSVGLEVPDFVSVQRHAS